MSKPQIKKVEAYRVRHNGRYYLRATAAGAASKLAWLLILDKYDIWDSWTVTEWARQEPPIEHPTAGECTCQECDERDLYGDPIHADWDGCKLHDRNDGYYKRLHDRLARWILAGME